MFTGLLLWLSGVDRELLAKCTRLPRSERLRFAGLGGLVLIPAIMGLGSMTYAVYTFVPDLKLSIACGVVWSAIALWIDRFLVMTLHKSSIVPGYMFGAGCLVRGLLACTLGIGLAHPLVLLMFSGPIQLEMADEVRARQLAAFQQANSIKAAAYTSVNEARTEATRDLAAELDHKMKVWECMSTLVSLEQARGVAPGTPARDRDGNICGVASGEEGCKDRCRVYVHERDHLADEIGDIKRQIQARLDVVDESGIQNATQYAARLQQQVAEEKMPTDYAARTRALAAVEAKHPEIRVVHLFLVFFLTLVDTVVVVLKAITLAGEYEELRDAALVEARAVAQAQRAASLAWANSHYQNVLQVRLSHEAHKSEINALLQSANDAFQEQAQQFRQFIGQMDSLYENVRKVRDNEDRQIFSERLKDIQRSYGEVWAKALERFRAYIKDLP